jgi:hypothetical protein
MAAITLVFICQRTFVNNKTVGFHKSYMNFMIEEEVAIVQNKFIVHYR